MYCVNVEIKLHSSSGYFLVQVTALHNVSPKNRTSSVTNRGITYGIFVKSGKISIITKVEEHCITLFMLWFPTLKYNKLYKAEC